VGALKWLPIAGLERTGLVLDRFSIPDKPKPTSETQKRLYKRAERERQVMEGPSPAAEALACAIVWKERIEVDGATRADIARHEGLTRARVTQIMTLLQLPTPLQERLLSNDPGLAGCSVRWALGIAKQISCADQSADQMPTV
jgi:hypothetical protein